MLTAKQPKQKKTALSEALARAPQSTPRFIEPMKALLADALPSGPEWAYEVKLDGIRAIAIRDNSQIKIFSRRPRDLTAEYPEIVRELERLPAKQWILDGEIVAVENKGRSSFQLLQNRKNTPTQNQIFLYLFDVINLDGHDIAQFSWEQRRALLQAILKKADDPIRLSASLEAPAAAVWKEIVEQGLEGVIAKRRDSRYGVGRRSGAWLKVKTQNEQEFVIGGYTPPEGSRKYFGAIMVGYYDGNDLMFASRVGTGFDFAKLKWLYERFQKLRAEKCPFANLPTKRRGRFGGGVTAADMRRCVWLQPKLVCQVRFYEWTADGNLRQPVYLGLREDKRATEVVREVREKPS
jgi:bifunctional non-homologous end joining protein LigD